jgi:hypothetical protein
MVRSPWILLAIVLLGPPPVLAQDKGPAGTWKLMLPLQPVGTKPLWLLKIEQADGAWKGEVISTNDGVPPAKIGDVSLKEDTLRFTLALTEGRFAFEFKAPADAGEKLLGNFAFKGQVSPAQLERTTLAKLDAFEINKELIARQTAGIEVVRAAITLTSNATKKGAKPEEVRSWIDKGLKAAEAYGARWQRDLLLDICEVLNEQDGLAQVALPYARRAERALEPRDRVGIQKRTLEVLQTCLEKAGKGDEAKEIAERVKKLDSKVKTVAFAGRKGKSDRAVVVELFTGAECPPCVAADLGFDALLKTFKPTEVICLQYHQHIPRADPLTNADGETRFNYYGKILGEDAGSTPTILFNGKPKAPGGGGNFEAQDKYDEYQEAIFPMLEEAAKVKLKLSAAQKGTKIDIKAETSELDSPSADIRLRLLLVEDVVKYTGGNKLAEHHAVVRAFPGGPEGMALREKSGSKEVTVDIEKLRKELTDYLDTYAKNHEPGFPNKDRPLELKKLRVVALVQNDKTREILQAAQADVEEK